MIVYTASAGMCEKIGTGDCNNHIFRQCGDAEVYRTARAESA